MNFIYKFLLRLQMYLDNQNAIMNIEFPGNENNYRATIVSSGKGGIIPKFNWKGCKYAVNQIMDYIEYDKGALIFEKAIKVDVGDDFYRYQIRKISTEIL